MAKRVRECANGQWLATSDVYPRIGVVGDTEEEAVAKLEQAVTAWVWGSGTGNPLNCPSRTDDHRNPNQ